ncbi:unnamed protein product, partial [Ascophyllum nodosum]
MKETHTEARNNVERLIKEPMATDNIQAIVRQRLPICKVHQTRKYEVPLMEQREAAAIRLQSTARRRLAVKTGQRRRSEKNIMCATHEKLVDAPANSRYWTKNGLRWENSNNQAFTNHKMASGIQRSARNSLTNALEIGSRQELDDQKRLSMQFVVEIVFKDAASCVQGAVRKALQQIPTLLDNHESDIQRHRDVTSYALRHESSSCMRHSATYYQNQGRVTVLEEWHEAASQIQRAVRGRQARDRAFTLQRLRTEDAWQKKEGSELEKRRVVEVKATECTQGQVRGRQAVGRVGAGREEKDDDTRRMQEGKEKKRRAAECIQRAVRCTQAAGRLSELLRQQRVGSRAELRRQQESSASCIQRVIRCRQARNRASSFRRQRDGDMHRKLEREAELELQWVVETKAAKCIQRQVRSRQAVMQVTVMRQQRDADMWRMKEEQGAQLRAVATEYEQCAVEQASELVRQRNMIQRAELERTVELEQQQGRAVSCIQRAVRCRQAHNHTTTLRRRHDDDILRKQEGVEMKRQWDKDTGATDCVQRQVRSRQTVMRVATVKQQRDEDVWRMQEREGLQRHEVAAECVQRALRCHQAVGRVSELRRQRDMRRRVELELQQGRAASCIQRAVWCRQARNRAAFLRRRHDDDIRRRREEVELKRRWEVETEAAKCIQRQVRSRQAVMQVSAMRQQRYVDMRRVQEEGERRREVAIECVQRAVALASERLRQQEMIWKLELVRHQNRAVSYIQRAVRCRQARDRVAILRRWRDDGIRLKREEAELKRKWEVDTEAAKCIQHQMRSHQAIRRVTIVRQQKDEDMRRMQEEEGERRRAVATEYVQRAIALACQQLWQHEMRWRVQLKQQQGMAASCIQRAVRCRQARDRAAALRRRRDDDKRQKREEPGLKQSKSIDAEAAECIQRLVRSRQAVKRVNAARQQRDENMRRMQEEEEARRHTVAAECIQHAVRCHQAVERISELRRQQDMRQRTELERQEDRAASYIQRAVRCRQARDRVITLRRRCDDDMRRNWEEAELKQRWSIETKAAECIQRQVRSRQAIMQLTTMRQQRDADKRRVQEEEGERRREVAIECVQRAVALASEQLWQQEIILKVELVRQQDTAVSCIQRAVRCRQARDRATILRRRCHDGIRLKREEADLERRWEVDTEAAKCIQRQVRSRQAIRRVTAVRQQRDEGMRRMQE